MTRQNKSLVRMAIAIHDQLAPITNTPKSVELPAAAWRQCEILHRKIRRASQRGWQLAAGRLRHDLQQALGRLRGELQELDSQFELPADVERRASTSDIYADLTALHDEFEEVSFDRRGHILSVTTEAIELDGVYLGPFEIQLDWSNLPQGHPYNYRVIAVDPHPAAANDSVTHPHVQDELVCEGEARQSLRAALQQGRLLDFFLIVANLLRTYNSSSPFISLSDWHGVECGDCGSTVCDDERWTCEKCETSVCGECYHNCTGCDGIFCHQCVLPCEGCDENHCHGCLNRCLCCHAELCQSCLNENERCTDCHEQELGCDGSEGELSTNEGERGSSAPLPAERVGEVVIPA